MFLNGVCPVSLTPAAASCAHADWLQNTHAPVQVPDEYAALYNLTQGSPQLATFYGMVSVVDEAVANITAALKRGDLWESSEFGSACVALSFLLFFLLTYLPPERYAYRSQLP